MDKQLMIQALKKHADGYRAKHPATADMDISICKAYCCGQSATLISMEIPCAESTVYRAIRRVESYLEQQNTAAFTDILREQLSQIDFPAGNWDANSVLELLYCAYNEVCGFESDQIKGQFKKLCHRLRHLSIQEMDPIIEEVCSLCRTHEENGFIEGVKIGVRLVDELNS